MTDLPEDQLVKITEYALKTGDESVSEQYEEVQSIRLRASFLITANALSATLFSQFLPETMEMTLILAFAIVAFTISNFFCVFVMIPNSKWRITKSARQIIEDFVDADVNLTAGKILGVLAIKTDEDQLKNETIVSSAHSMFFFASFFFVVSNICWLFHLGALTAVLNGGRQ